MPGKVPVPRRASMPPPPPPPSLPFPLLPPPRAPFPPNPSTSLIQGNHSDDEEDNTEATCGHEHAEHVVEAPLGETCKKQMHSNFFKLRVMRHVAQLYAVHKG